MRTAFANSLSNGNNALTTDEVFHVERMAGIRRSVCSIGCQICCRIRKVRFYAATPQKRTKATPFPLAM